MSFLKSIERGGKRLLIRLIGSTMHSDNCVEVFHRERADVKKILVLRLEQKVGNVVMTTFFPHALKDIFPGARVDLLVHESAAPLWDNNPHVDTIHVFSHRIHLRNPLLLLRFFLMLRRSGYDVVLDCSTPGGFSVSSALLSRFTGARFRAGFLRGESDRFLNMTVPPDHSKHYIMIMHDLLKLLGNEKVYRPEIYVSDDETASARRKYARNGADFPGNYILIWLGAHAIKQWDVSHFRELARLLRKTVSMPVFYFCGPAERGIYADLLQKESGSLIYIDDLRELAALIRMSNLFISGDAGPMHLAAALDVKTVAVFLQDNFTVFGYNDGVRHRVVDLSGDKDDIDGVFQACLKTLSLPAPQKTVTNS